MSVVVRALGRLGDSRRGIRQVKGQRDERRDEKRQDGLVSADKITCQVIIGYCSLKVSKVPPKVRKLAVW
jgi:hypothetical protein